MLGLAAVLATWSCASGDTTGFGGSDTSSSGTGGTTSSGGGTGGATGGSGGSGGSSACQVDCSQIQAPVCQVAQCNEQTGQCEVVADTDGTVCEDGLFCTATDSCQAGLCEPGPANDCGIAPAACEVIVCDEQGDSCSTQASQDNDPCIDPNDLCIENGHCSNGLCIGTPKDCFMQPVPDDCHVSECNPQNGQCEPVVGNEGGACADPNDLCTVNKTCVSGVCQGGSPKDCSYLTVGCVMGVCDVNTGQCGTQSAGEGNPCDDLDSCTTGEICTSGNCGGGTPITQCINNDSCCPSGCTEQTDLDCAMPFNQPSYNAELTFTDQLPSTTMNMAWDGTSLWTCSGGGSSGNRLSQHNANGGPLSLYQPGIDMRSVFTKGDGAAPLYARGYNSMQIRVQTSPGVFGNDVSLSGSVDSQVSVVWDSDNNLFVAMYAGTLYRWNPAGASLANVSLVGWGTMNNENTYPQDRGVATVKGFYFTYASGVLSAWSDQGVRIDTTNLNGAGTSFDSHFSLSYAQSKVWIVDSPGSTWRGYNVGL